MEVCELMNVEGAGWHFPLSVLRRPLTLHEQQIEDALGCT